MFGRIKQLFAVTLSAFALSAVFAAPFAARAQTWTPPGPIKLMIGFTAGGGADTQARLIASELEKRLGWKIIPEQVTGKGGLNLAVELAKQPADGTAIGFVVSETLAYNLMAAKNAPVKLDDFTLLASTAQFQMGVVALTSKGWKDMNDVFTAAKSGQPIRFGAMSPRLADIAYLLGQANDARFNVVQVRGGKAVKNGVNAGDMDLGFMAGIQAKEVAAGEMTNLASAIAEPLAMQPDARLLSDYGLDFNAQGFFMFIAPAGLPEDARRAFTSAINEIVADPGTEANKFINRAFGGPYQLSGDKLTGTVRGLALSDRELLQAAGR